MFSTIRWNLIPACFVLTLAVLPSVASAQTPAPANGYSQRLAAFQQQNAFLQQQSAVQNALQQTNLLVQAANRLNGAVLVNGAALPTDTINTINFQQQQFALQMAIQQTSAMLLTSGQPNSGLNQTALRQLNTLQATLQESRALQSSLAQSGQLTPIQIFKLTQEQNTLSKLLTTQPPGIPTRTPAR